MPQRPTSLRPTPYAPFVPAGVGHQPRWPSWHRQKAVLPSWVGKGDRRALEQQALAWGDACLIGAGTLRAHQCTCLIRHPQLLEQRRSEGRTGAAGRCGGQPIPRLLEHLAFL